MTALATTAHHPPAHHHDPVLELAARWLAAQTNPNTITAYRGDVVGPTRTGTPWITFCHEAGAHPLTTDRTVVDLWRHALVADNCSPSTIARRLSALSSFYAYAVDEGAAPANPVARVKRPRLTDESQALGLTTAQVRTLLTAAEAHGPQTHALVALLATTGLRVTEALSLDADGITVVRGHSTVTVVAKGGKTRTVVLTPTVRGLVDDLGRTTGPVFLDRTGKRMTRKAAASLIALLGKRIGVAGLHPHAMRHSAATNALEAGVELQKVQDLLGHADPRTTRRYDRARNALDANPAYRLADLYA